MITLKEQLAEILWRLKINKSACLSFNKAAVYFAGGKEEEANKEIDEWAKENNLTALYTDWDSVEQYRVYNSSPDSKLKSGLTFLIHKGNNRDVEYRRFDEK